MKKIVFSIWLLIGLANLSVLAQGRVNDIPISKLPNEVKNVLEKYISILSNATSIESCSSNFVQIAGGSLVNEDAQNITLRETTHIYSLKKDFENIKFYAQPIKISRINVSTSSGSGFGESAIRGKVYKIWIEKKQGVAGLPAPISIMIPENHPVIKTPKIINIGSL